MPNNHHMAEAGLPDSREEALAYLASLSLGLLDPDFASLIVDDGPQVVQWLETVSPLRFESIAGFPDYHPEKPGGRPAGGRSMDPVLFAYDELGPWADKVARSHRSPHVRLKDTPLGGGTGFVDEAVLAERARHDDRGCGNGLVGPLLKALLDRGIEPALQWRATDLLEEGGRVVGVSFDTP